MERLARQALAILSLREDKVDNRLHGVIALDFLGLCYLPANAEEPGVLRCLFGHLIVNTVTFHSRLEILFGGEMPSIALGHVTGEYVEEARLEGRWDRELLTLEERLGRFFATAGEVGRFRFLEHFLLEALFQFIHVGSLHRLKNLGVVSWDELAESLDFDNEEKKISKVYDFFGG